jgi:hypothetical protein
MSGRASTEFYLNAFLTTDTHLPSTAAFDSFLKKLEEKKSGIKKEKDFVRYIFSKTHQSFLKKYEAHASFSELFENGSYNCLTGTILYATILNHFQIPFEVIETNYHIFLTVETAQGKVLLEATDPLDGFVSTPNSIEKRINTYKQNTITASNKKATYYHFSFDLFKTVSMEELRGLLYYNKAVDSFNKQKLEESTQFLLMAKELYYSPRIDEFSAVLLQAVKLSACSEDVKEELLKAVYAISHKNSPAVASLQGY